MFSTTTWTYDAVMEPVIKWFNCLLDHKGFDWWYSVRSVWQIHNNYIFLSRFAEQRRKWQTLTSTWPSKLYSIFKLIQNTFQIICSTFEWWGQLRYFFTFLKTLKSKAHNQIVNCRTLHKSWGDDPELDNAYVHVHSLILKWDMGLGLGLSLQSSHQSRS